MPKKNAYRTNTGIHIEWFTIRQSSVWAAVLFLLVLAGAGYFGYWAWSHADDAPPTTTATPAAGFDRSARFLSLRGNVEIRRVGKYEFEEANSAMRLAQGDVVRTFGTSSARVQLFDGTEYLVKPDSILVIEEAFEDPASKATRTGVTLNVGRVNLTSPSRAEPGSSSELSTEVGSADIEENTTMDVTYDSANRQAEFRVHRGETSLSTREGQQLTLTRQQAVDVSERGFSAIVHLPGIPFLDYPSNLERVASGQPIEFRWQAVRSARRYKVMIARTPEFYDPLVEANVAELSMLHKSLPVGSYYWQVSALDGRGESGAPSQWAKFTVGGSVRSTETIASPELTVMQPNVSLDGVVTVRGRVSSASVLTVDVGGGDERIRLKDDGSFAHYFTARRAGRHTIVVRARGREGGASVEKTVYADVGTGR